MVTREQLIVGAFIATWPIAGFVEPFTPGYGRVQNEVSLIHTFVLAILLFAWCKAHAAARGITPPTAAPLLVAVIAPIGLPYYLFRAFPWRTAIASLGKSLLVVLLCVLLYSSGQYLGLLLAT